MQESQTNKTIEDYKKQQAEMEKKLKELKRKLKQYEAKEVLNRKCFKYELFDTHRGNTHIRVLFENQDGLIEVARIYLSKNLWVRENFSIEDVYEDLKK